MSRYRERSYWAPDQLINSYYGSTKTGRYTNATNHSCLRHTKETCTDEIVPNFHKRVAMGEVFFNPYTKTDLCQTESVGSYHRESVVLKYKYFGNFTFSNYLCNPFLDRTPEHGEINIGRLIDLAITQAYANVDSSKANLLETLAESGKTITFLKEKLLGAVSIYKALRRFDLKRARRGLKSLSGCSLKELRQMKKSGAYLANRYMEVRYAIRPLIMDTMNIMEGLTDPPKVIDRFTFRGFAADSTTASYEGSYSHGSLRYLLGQTNYHYRQNSTRTVNVKAGVLTSIDSVNPFNVFGFDQVIETAWALVPFSFIADWFVNIGNTLASWTPEMGVTVLGSWYTITDTMSLSTKPTHAVYIPYNQYDVGGIAWINGGDTLKTSTTVTRVVKPERPIIPSLKVNLNALKLLDLAIILKRFLR